MGGSTSLQMRTGTVLSVLSVHIILLPGIILAYQQYNGCIFGGTCYFQCICRSDTCDSLTGNCKPNVPCAEADQLILDYYPQEKSSGAACQVHNLAYERHAVFSTDGLDGKPHTVITSGNIEQHFTTFTYETAAEALVVDLAELFNIEFVEVLLHPQQDVAHFRENFIVSLDTEIEEFSTNELVCTVRDHPFLLIQLLPNNIQRVHYRCASPSTAKVVKITPHMELTYPFNLSLVRIIAVGHRYIDIDQLACLVHDGDEVFRWCKVCDGSYPPDCRRKCLTGYWGENCENTCSLNCSTGMCRAKDGACICPFGQCPSSTTLVNPTEDEATYNITQSPTYSIEDGGGILGGNMLIVVIVTSVLVLSLAFMVVTFLVCRKKHNKKQKTSQLPLPAKDARYKSSPTVLYVRNLPSVHAENASDSLSLYEEIPADLPNDQCQPSTNTEGQYMLPRYSAVLANGGNAKVSSEYMTTGQMMEKSPYLQPRQLPSRPMAGVPTEHQYINLH